MSRILIAGSASEPDRQLADDWRFRDLPSGLASLILHFLVLIVLGVLYLEPRPAGFSEVTLNLQDLGDAELDGSEFEAPIELDAAPSAAEAELSTALPAAVADAAALPALDAPLPPLTPPSLDVSESLSDLAVVGGDPLRGEGRGAQRGTGKRKGPSSNTSMFGLADEGARIVYVFDRSESMNSVFTLTSGSQSVSITPLEAAKAELMRSLGDLSEAAEFSVIFYNNFPAAFPDPLAEEGVSRATPQTRVLSQSFVYGMVAERSTEHVPALRMALGLEPDVIFLLTDGESKDDPSSADLRMFEKLCRQTGTRINVIHFCVELRTTTTLRGLAEKTGGQFKTITFRSLLEPNF